MTDKVNTIKPCSEDVEHSNNKQVPPSREECLKKLKYEYGTLDVDLFMKKLLQDGISDAKLERNGTALVISIPSEDTSIRFEESSTHITCGGKQSLRLKLRDFVMKCLQSF